MGRSRWVYSSCKVKKINADNYQLNIWNQCTGAFHLLMINKEEYRFGRSFHLHPEHLFHRVFHLPHFRPGYYITGPNSLGLELHIRVLLALNEERSP